MKTRPAWLLAVVFVAALAALVIMQALELDEGATQVLSLVVPILTALFIIDRVDGRSDAQDEKLQEHSDTLATVERATNGELTERLTQAMKPIHDRLDTLDAALARNHPNDPALHKE